MKYDIVKLMVRRKIRWKKRWVSGDSGGRLTFRSKKAGRLSDYRIYGNTVGGESVGDRTGNLFDGELTDGYHLDGTTGFPVNYNGRFATLQPITINQSEYCLTYNSTTDLRFMYSVFNDDTLIRREAVVNNRYLRSGDAIDTSGGNKIYFAFFNNDYSHASTSMISNIMLNEGSTALPYEPYGYKVPVTVEGKNLFDVSTITLGRYINDVGQIIQNDNIDTSDFIKVSPNTNYTYKSAAIYDGNIIRIAYYDQSKNFISRHFTPGNAANGETVTTPSNCEYVKLSYDNVITNLMLNSGSAPLPYEPYHAPVTTPIYLPEPIEMVGDEAEYIDYAEQKQHRVRKNQVVSKVTSRTIDNGDGTFFYITAHHDGSVTCNGYAKSTIFISNSYIAELEASTRYILSGCPQRGTYMSYRLDLRFPTGQAIDPIVDYGIGYTFSVDTPGIYVPTVRIAAGYTCDNLTFYPMIRKADIEDDTYEPYIENTEVDMALPEIAITAGTNVLSVGTAVQPSKIEVKGRIKAVGQETEPEQEAAEPEQEAAEAEQEAAEPEQEEPEVKEDDTDDR